jgi:hypothetical protein
MTFSIYRQLGLAIINTLLLSLNGLFYLYISFNFHIPLEIWYT